MKLKSAIVAKRNSISAPHLVLLFRIFAVFSYHIDDPAGGLALIHCADFWLACDIEGDADFLIFAQHKDNSSIGQALPRNSTILLDASDFLDDFTDADGLHDVAGSVNSFFADVVGDVPLKHLHHPHT